MSEDRADRPEPHLDALDVVSYVAGKVPSSERVRIEAHLANCELCTAEVAAVWRLRPRRVRRAAWLPIGAAAAAVIAGVLLLRPPAHQAPPGIERNPEWRPTIGVVSPAEGATIAGHPVLVWHAVAGASVYRVTVSAQDGDSVWAGTTVDTTLPIPPDVALSGTERYYWYVDALLSDGRSLTSGAHAFKTGP